MCAAIAENIIQAVESSRRTILVLTPAYAQSEWCRLEYQKAQHEMLKMRHRIIPIMLEDVTPKSCPNMDRNLQTILETVTYLKWPGSDRSCLDVNHRQSDSSKCQERFWKLLQLSMPKRKHWSQETTYPSSAGSQGTSVALTPSHSYSGELHDACTEHVL